MSYKRDYFTGTRLKEASKYYRGLLHFSEEFLINFFTVLSSDKGKLIVLPLVRLTLIAWDILQFYNFISLTLGIINPHLRSCTMRRPCLLEYPDSPLYLSRRRKAFRGTCVWFPYRSGTRPISSLPTRGRTPVTVFTISRRYLILLSWNEVRGEAHRRDGAGRWEMA